MKGTSLARAANAAEEQRVVLSPDVDLIREQVSRDRASRAFRLSPRLVRFLEFTVGKALDGSAGQLKEYLIGVEVYDRGDGFDPKSDSIVRSEAVRLRERLGRYYEAEGGAEEQRISYRKGCYAPVFEVAARAGPPASLPVRNTIAVLPFVNVGAHEDCEFFSEGLTDELISSFARIPGLRVVARIGIFTRIRHEDFVARGNKLSLGSLP